MQLIDYKATDRIDEILYDCREIDDREVAINTAVHIFQSDAPYLGYDDEQAEAMVRDYCDSTDWHRPATQKAQAA